MTNIFLNAQRSFLASLKYSSPNSAVTSTAYCIQNCSHLFFPSTQIFSAWKPNTSYRNIGDRNHTFIFVFLVVLLTPSIWSWYSIFNSISLNITEVYYSLISALTNLDILTNFGYLGVTFTLLLTENSKYMLSAPLSTPPVVSVSTTFKLVKQLTPWLFKFFSISVQFSRRYHLQINICRFKISCHIRRNLHGNLF